MFDPTVDRKWMKLKAEQLNVRLKVEREKVKDQLVPHVFRGELGGIKNPAGWGKSLCGLPVFTKKEVDSFVENVNEKVAGNNAVRIRKQFERGKQLVKENFVDLFRFLTKEDSRYFYVKSLVGASLKQKDRWVSVSIRKDSAEIQFCYCECEAGKSGTCSHAYAVLHLLAKWSLEQLTEVPDPVPVTSALCSWNIPQARGRTDTPKFMSMNFNSTTAKKRRSKYSSKSSSKKRRDENTPGPSESTLYETSESSFSSDDDTDMQKEPKGISSNAYEARSVTKQKFDGKEVERLVSKMSMGKNADVPACYLFQGKAPYGFDLTTFGEVPVGSPLSYQCPLIEFGYNIHCSFVKSSTSVSFHDVPKRQVDYPAFPVNKVPDFTNKLLLSSVTNAKELDTLKKLVIDSDSAKKIELETRKQYLAKNWGKERFYRFTASLHKDLKEKKTERSFTTLAKQFLEKRQNKAVPDFYLRKKLEHGRYFEPEAIKVYCNYFKMIGHQLTYDKSGLVINPEYYYMGASPDGKIIDLSFDGHKKFGIVEVKCPEQFKDVDPKHAAWVSDKFCLQISDDGELRINKDHAYYDQIQHQLALTGCHFCDFVVYTFKGTAIDRVYFDIEHWKRLCDKICTFYFKYYLPILCTV